MNNNLTIPKGKPTLLDIRLDARTYPRLHTFSREKAIERMSRTLSELFIFQGRTIDAYAIQLMSGAVIEELMDDTDNLGTRLITFEEIGRAIKKAIIEEDVFLNSASVLRIILKYVRGDGHLVCKQAEEIQRQNAQLQLKDSIIAPMLHAYAGALVKHSNQ